MPYKQIGVAMTDLIGGQIHVLFVDTAAADTYVTSGQLRPLAVTRAERMSRHPNLPALAETWPEFVVTGFLGMAVPSATPQEAQQALNDTINDAISSEPMRSRLEGFGFTPRRMTLTECAAHVRNERAKWKRFVALARIEPQ